MSALREAVGGRERRIISWRRLSVSLAVGAVAATAVLGWVWRISWPQDYAGTKRLAEEEGHSHVTDTAVLVAAVASLVAVFEGLVRTSRYDTVAVAAITLAVVDTILSWALVHTVFALKYARLYYAGGDGGIVIDHDEPPAYCDFAYVAFTVGMSFAVSDTALETTQIRKVALGHALLSYVFGTVLIAVAVSLLTTI